MYLPVLSSFSVLTCVVLLLLLRAMRMNESLQRKSFLNLLFAICLSTVCRSAGLPVSVLAVSLSTFLTACLSAGFLFCLLVYVPASLRPVLLITCLLVC